MWERRLEDWALKASWAKDEGMEYYLDRIKTIPTEVKYFVLRYYVKQCRSKHVVAFL